MASGTISSGHIAKPTCYLNILTPPKAAVGRTPATTGLGGLISRALNGLPDHAVREETNGRGKIQAQSTRISRIAGYLAGERLAVRTAKAERSRRELVRQRDDRRQGIQNPPDSVGFTH
jgi:hypothetical protein